MINALTGRPGGGKSYEAVAFHIIPALKEGRKVITNVALNISHFEKVLGKDLIDELLVVVDGQLDQYGSIERPFSKVEHYKDEWRNGQGQAPLYVIDEAHLSLGRGANDAVLEWYSMHRHYGVDILLMTQNLRKVHRDIKDMVEIHYYCVKNAALGSAKSYTRKVKGGANGTVLNEGVRKYKKEYFPFYKSHTSSNKAVEEAVTKDVTPLWKHWTVWLSILMIGGGLFFIVSSGGFFSSVDAEPTPQTTETTSPTPSSEPNTPNEPPKKRVVDPLGEYVLYASGETVNVVFDENQRPIRSKSFHVIYIDVFEKDYKLFTMTNVDLIEMGYEFRTLTECVYSLTFKGSSRLVVCGDYEKQQENNKNMFAATPLG